MFDIIITNPPYQEMTGGGMQGAKPVYPQFVELSKKLTNKSVVMVTPSRWLSFNTPLNKFKHDMLLDNKVQYIKYYKRSRDVFPTVDMAGGICYFLWEKNYNGLCCFSNSDENETEMISLTEFPAVITERLSRGILRKVLAKSKGSLSDLVCSRGGDGFVTSSRGSNSYFEGSIKLRSSAGESYVLPKKPISSKWFAMAARNHSISHANAKVLSSIKLLPPKTAITDSYIKIGGFDDEITAKSLVSYLKTRLVRFLVGITQKSIHISKTNFIFVPLQDFNCVFSDEQLFSEYELSREEIDYIKYRVCEYYPEKHNGENE